MKLLLDTHTFIWWDDDYKQLSDKVQSALINSENEVYLSLVSIWEMQIKIQLGKLEFNSSLKTKISDQVNNNSLQILPILDRHIYELNSLPHHHRDPFDRLLIAQVRIEGMTFLTRDISIQNYDVTTMW